MINTGPMLMGAATLISSVAGLLHIDQYMSERIPQPVLRELRKRAVLISVLVILTASGAAGYVGSFLGDAMFCVAKASEGGLK